MALENKLGIQEDKILAREEERLSKTKAIQMFDGHILDELTPGTYETLAKIHQYLFEDIYSFAGKLRYQNLAKGYFQFAPVLFLESTLQTIERMPQKTFTQIIQKYVEMNIAHPFREGNGRSTRIWLNHILKQELNLVIDWSRINKNDYLQAMERSPIQDLELQRLLQAALTDQIDDRNIYLQGIDASYDYEGMQIFQSKDLH